MKCSIYALVGDNAITLEDGQKVFELIKPELAANRSVELDFARVIVFASPFFNAAMGQLLRDLKPEDLNRLLRVVDLSPVGQEVLKRVIENAKQYYASGDSRKAHNEVLEKFAKES